MFKILQNVFGLSAAEAKLYIAASQTGEGTISEIARSAKIPRTAAYIPIQSLTKKGMISTIKAGKRLNYQAVEPESLLSLYDRNKSDLKHVVSELSKSIKIPGGSDIRYFPSERGIATACDIFLDSSKTKIWRSFDNPPYTNQTFYLQSIQNYVDKRVEKKIKAKVIVSTGTIPSWMEDFIRRDIVELRETMIISHHTFPFEASITSNGNMVIIIFGGDGPSAVIITNKDLAVTVDSIFDFLWTRTRG